LLVDKEWALAKVGAAVDELNRQLLAFSRIVYSEDSWTSFKVAGPPALAARLSGGAWLWLTYIHSRFL
jgi:hypothetical protein